MITEYEDYLEDLATANKLLSSPGRKSFIRYGTAEAAPEKTGKLSVKYMVHSEFSGRAVETLYNWQSQLDVLQQVGGSGTLEANIRTARATTLTIARQLIARLRHDADTGASCELINGLENEITMEPLSMEDVSAFGWRILLRFTTWLPDYDEDDWNIIP